MHPERLEYSFIISSVSFTLVRVGADPEPILGTLGTSWEYTQDGSPVHLRTHTVTLKDNLETPDRLPACF